MRRLPKLLTRWLIAGGGQCNTNQILKRHQSISAAFQPSFQKTLPITAKLNQALCDAKRILVHDDGISTDSNLQRLITEEVMTITQILQKMVGTNNSLSEIQKLYENDSSSDHFIRGLLVLLISKAACQNQLTSTNSNQVDISNIQWRLAKIVEMIHMAILIHKQIRNVQFTQSDSELQNSSNKISVLYGDFLWAKAWKELADMGDIEVIDMMVSVLVNTSEGQFLSEVELSDASSKMNLDYWFKKNYLLTACLPAFGCKSTLKLAKIDPKLQQHAHDFGQNFGFFNKAYQEIQWFQTNQISSFYDTIDFCSLPAILHSHETDQSLDDLIIEHSTTLRKIDFDYQSLYDIVRKGPGLSRSKDILDNFRSKALENLEPFPDCEATNHLKNILKAMDV